MIHIVNLFASVSFSELGYIWATVILASVLRSFTGFGFALVAVPAFSFLLPPQQAVVLSTSLAFTVSLLSIRSYWADTHIKPMVPIYIGAIFGTIVGAIVLTHIAKDVFKLLVGLTVIGSFIVLTWFRPNINNISLGVKEATGILSGVMNGALAIPGPPIVIYAIATQSDPRKSRAFLTVYFLGTAIFALLTFTISGFVTRSVLALYLGALPILYIGDKVGYFLFQKFGTDFYRRVALTALLIIGVSVTLQVMF